MTVTANARFGLLARLLLAGAFTLLFADSAQAQPTALADARSAYEFAEYNKAANLFSKVAESSSASKDTRREALRYLGRVHLARGQTDKAREAVMELIKTQPPAVELNPNREPPDLMNIFYEAQKEMTGGYGVSKKGPGLQTIAIMDFQNASVDERERYSSLTAGFPSMVINYLSGTTDLQVIERQRINWLLKELELQKKADVVDQSTAVRTGKVLGATTVLFGNYIVHEDQMRISARVVKVETSEILLAEEVFGEPDEFFELVRDLTTEVTRAINVEMEETELESGAETRSLDARIAYSDGLVALDDGNYQAAKEHFEQALEYDPDYTLAQERMESLRPMLAAANEAEADSSGGTRPDSK